MSITKNIALNGVAQVVQKIVRVIDQLILVPFFLTNWGEAYYGEWLTLSIVPSILAFSDLGFGSAVSNSFVLSYASGDKQRAADIRRAGLLVVLGAICLGVILSIAILLIGDHQGLFEKCLIERHDAIWAITIMMASRLVGFFNQYVEGFFRAGHKAALGTFLSSGTSLFNIIASIIVLSLGYGVVEYASVHLLTTCISVAIYHWLGTKYVNLTGFKGRVLKSDFVMFAQKGVGYMMSPMWQIILFQGSTFMVRIVLGSEAVAIYNTARTACRSVSQIVSTINGAIFPELQLEYGKGNMPLVRKIFSFTVCCSSIIGIISTVLLATIGQIIYEWWTNSMLSMPFSIWLVFSLSTLINAIWWTAVVVYRMTNQPSHFAISSISTAAVTVGLTYILSQYFGLMGAVICCLLFEFIMAVYICYDSCKIIGIKGGYWEMMREGIMGIKEFAQKANKKVL